MITHAWFKTTLAIAVATASCQLMANGLAINERLRTPVPSSATLPECPACSAPRSAVV